MRMTHAQMMRLCHTLVDNKDGLLLPIANASYNLGINDAIALLQSMIVALEKIRDDEAKWGN